MNYDELSGIELDALVCFRILGWWWGREEKTLGPQYDCVLYPPTSPKYKPEYLLDGPMERPMYRRDMLHPTTDANDRDILVEKMRELGFVACLISDGSNTKDWAARFFIPYVRTSGFHHDPKVGRAVAIAALKALEAKS